MGKAPKRVRADQLLVAQGLSESRARAQASIAAGLVTADGVKVMKPSQAIACGAWPQAAPEHPWVSRGGVKLAAALDRFGFDPQGKICLDVGASTGGFSEVLLSRGARRIYAVDVGRGQLHASLKKRPEIVSLERTDARRLDRKLVPDLIDLVVADVSFISLTKVLPAALKLAALKAALVALIKPQFEAGRARVKKGIVREAAVHREACADLVAFVAGLGWEEIGLMESPIRGGDGNTEFLMGARRG
jgi:23S rRNA (cytidine1920-2'-O)/16S rRNA (cytidine1409-2'-O)-methyltransferase